MSSTKETIVIESKNLDSKNRSKVYKRFWWVDHEDGLWTGPFLTEQESRRWSYDHYKNWDGGSNFSPSPSQTPEAFRYMMRKNYYKPRTESPTSCVEDINETTLKRERDGDGDVDSQQAKVSKS